MTTIHLTDAQRDTFAACGLIVIDGEQQLTYDTYDVEFDVPMVAPECWRILTEPCDGRAWAVNQVRDGRPSRRSWTGSWTQAAGRTIRPSTWRRWGRGSTGAAWSSWN